ncbi:hypothetical protein N9926_00930 [Flavobacteriaceae bacterium]|nr:hypothetical protein [Flavobacteriaceae bacterium]
MEEYTIVEKYQQGKNQTIAVRPYVNYDKENMGLESYGMSLHEGVWHEESLACLEMNGVKRYVTGLNEFAPDIKKLAPGDRDLKIKAIRATVAELEAELASNILDPEDKDFWNNVQLLKPDNDKFWSRISLRCGNDPVYLDPIKDPYDRIKLEAIKAGGFSMISNSLKAAKTSANPKKFYLDLLEESITTRTEYTKLRNKALVQLEKMYDKDKTRLLYVAKVVDSDSVQYTKSTPLDIMYENMDAFISGEGTESNKKRAAEMFIDSCKAKMEDLKIRALIKDAMFYRFITPKPSGWIETLDSGLKLGKVPSEVLTFLKNPEHDDVLTSLMDKIEPYWK